MTLCQEKLAAGEILTGMACSFPCPSIIETVARNFDFCWIDAQHGPWGSQELMGAVRACDVVGCAALIRVADHTYGRIGQALDLAPAGVIVPCVETPEQARAIVDAACFPPLGNRSFGGRRVIDLHGRGYATNPALRPLVIAQIETPRGLENIQAIAATEGIDVLFYGPDDMKLRRGLPIDLPMHAPEIAPIVRKIGEACRQHGKYAMSVSGNPDDIRLMRDAGYRLIVGGSDVGFLRRGATESATLLTGILRPQ